MPRKSQPPDRASGTINYKAWGVHAAAQGIRPGIMRERDWRQLYIRGATPEEAVGQAEVQYHNTRPPIERIGRRR